MPLNTLRLNHQPSSHPSDRIVFIKPIPRPASQKHDYDRAELILKAIAAQCLPIMKDHYLSVTTLEEYEPNPEFIGRNFNNGEVIQLVLQSKSGAWLPLNAIQMVMMHELAHNTHMNHGKGFWQARNLYANEMRQLWAKGYTGEGLWGRGRTMQALENDLAGNILPSEEVADLPLCGGTYRSRRKKRKVKESSDLTWKEKRDKRIEKKFGKNGNALGADEDKRFLLQVNSKAKGSLGSAPRVAQSKRGRELRAAAALARFDTNKKEISDIACAAEEEEETGTESEYEEVNSEQQDALDRNGKKLSDSKGQPVIRVCEEEDVDDVNVKNELAELAGLSSIQRAVNKDADDSDATLSADESELVSAAVPDRGLESQADPLSKTSTAHQEGEKHDKKSNSSTAETRASTLSMTQPNASEATCGVCSMANDVLQLTCIACAHVLDIRKDPRHWKCNSQVCREGPYINAGDCGVCGVCGNRRPINLGV